MGSAKIPELITARKEQGLQEILDDQQVDPIIQKMRATPVVRKIEPEELNRRKILSTNFEANSEGVKKRITIQHRLKIVLRDIAILRSKSVRLRRRYMRSLLDQADKLRDMLDTRLSKQSKNSKRKTRKSKSKRR